jgi:hypothetical protein
MTCRTLRLLRQKPRSHDLIPHVPSGAWGPSSESGKGHFFYAPAGVLSLWIVIMENYLHRKRIASLQQEAGGSPGLLQRLLNRLRAKRKPRYRKRYTKNLRPRSWEKWNRLDILKENQKTFWVRLPDGTVIKRHKRKHVTL